jgi:hypothetical protein
MDYPSGDPSLWEYDLMSTAEFLTDVSEELLPSVLTLYIVFLDSTGLFSPRDGGIDNFLPIDTTP